MSYVTLAEFKDYVRSEIGSADDDELTAVLAAAVDAVDTYCGRTFTVAASATRLYVPNDEEVLYIDDCTSVTSVTYNGTVLAASTYQLEPVNGLSGGRAVPYTSIRNLVDEWEPVIEGKATISIVADFGWTATPDQVKQATKIVAKELLEARNSKAGYAEFGDMAARAMTHPKFSMLLSKFRRTDVVFGVA